MQLVAQGYRNKEIGEKLFVAEMTVNSRLHSIIDKLGVADRLELAFYTLHQLLTEQKPPLS